MTKLFIKYNPYTVESEIAIDGVLVQPPNKLADMAKERLQVWVEDLLPVVDEICNDDQYLIEFYGTSLDYNDLQITIQEYCESHRDIQVDLSFTEAKGSEDRFCELVDLFEEMQQDCPFEDLTTDAIKENFQNAISAEFEVSVIATMSSGKSTLINSLLGRELMPSKNEACTATIAKIKDVDGMDCFEAEFLSKDGKVLGRYDNLVLENMNEMNDNPETAFINIKGDIPNVESKGVQLVLVDTPGPNNSRTEEHKNHTYRVIKEKTKPMVLYVLNATQLQTNDDRELLGAVADAMKVGGKQSKDRFLFAVNKIDLFDPDKESVQGAIANVKEYLKKFGIENPNIFPTSAELAKVIRMNQAGQILTSAQKRTLRDYDFFLDEEQLHLSEQATLSKDNMKKIKKALQDARDNGDEYAEALIHTGVPAIEHAVNEYLAKYAYTAKVKTAVDTFKKKVEEKDMQAKMMQAIQNNEEEREKINQQLQAVKQILEEGNVAADFRKKIESLDMMKDARNKINKLRAKISTSIPKREEMAKTMTTLEVQRMMMVLNDTIRNLQSDVKTELENVINDVIVGNAESIMEDYRQYMNRLVSGEDTTTHEYKFQNSGISFLAEDIPNAQEIINKYKYEEEFDTGEEEWVKNTNKKWYKPWTWFEESGHYEKIYANREMVDCGTVFDDFIQPVMSRFNENLEGAKNTAEEEGKKFQAYFLKELTKMEAAFKKKVEENEQLTRDQKTITDKIEKDKENMEWLTNFLQKLDKILAI